MRVHSADPPQTRNFFILEIYQMLYFLDFRLSWFRAGLCRAELGCAVFRHPAKLEAEHLYFGGLRSCGGVGTESIRVFCSWGFFLGGGGSWVCKFQMSQQVLPKRGLDGGTFL